MQQELIKRILSSLLLIPIVIFFIFKGGIIFNLLILACLIISFYEWRSISKNKKYQIFGYIFLSLSFFTAYKLIIFSGDNKHFIFVLFICILTDIGGYIFGKLFKGPKISKISPNKTYSGMIGSLFFSILIIFIILNFSTVFYNINTTSIKLILLIIIISLVSQIGDFTISYFKRLSKIKNSGNLIPGHGGLLDRIDGMIFAFPFSYICFYSGIFNL
tara:strand:- start:518 stop:1168 length:651 start_codon:yes stop_codon:yes gene_type:complete